MVLPASPADAEARALPEWLSRIVRVLHLGRDKVIVLVTRGVAAQMRPLVRVLMDVDAGLLVCTSAPDLTRAPEGALVLFVPRVEDADWLNINRPFFAEFRLRVVIWADDQTVLGLQAQAPDFFDWISHVVWCPDDAVQRVPGFAVVGLRSAPGYPGVVWLAGDLDVALAAAYPGEEMLRASAHRSYGELIDAITRAGERRLVWVGVREPRDLVRVRWALAEMDRRGRCIVEQPACDAPGWWPAASTCSDLRDAAARLEERLGPAAALIAILLDLEPGAVALASQLIVSDVAALAGRLHRAEDPGAALAREALAQGVVSVSDAVRWSAVADEERADIRPPVLRGLYEMPEVVAHRAGIVAHTAERLAAWSQASDLPELAQRPEIADMIIWAQSCPSDPPPLPSRWWSFALMGHWIEAALRTSRPGDTWPESIVQVLIEGNNDAVERWRRERGLELATGELPDLPGEQDSPEERERAYREAISTFERACQTREHPFMARLMLDLGRALRGMKRYGEATDTLHEAIAITEQTYVGREHPIVVALMLELGSALTWNGQPEQARTVLTEAVDHYRKMTKRDPDRFIPELGKGLIRLSNVMADMGLAREALSYIEEAVEIFRKLANDNPVRYRDELAVSLHNLGARLNDLGRMPEALAPIDEVVNLCRHLVSQQPTQHLDALADSLNNLSVTQRNMGRMSEALYSIEEAVALYRQLADQQPVRFLPNLCTCLNTLSITQPDAGRALSAIEEAITYWRQLAKQHPARFQPDLAMGLNNLSSLLHDVGRAPEALAAIEEAVAHYRQLAEHLPKRFLPDLARSLSNLSMVMSDVERTPDALLAIEEAIEIFRSLDSQDPARSLPSLATSLYNLCIKLSKAGRVQEALPAAEESVALYRKFAGSTPARFGLGFLSALDSLATLQHELGNHDAARQAEDEAEAFRQRHGL